MRAHEFANYLNKLARILKQGPDFDFEQMHEVDSFSRYAERKVQMSYGKTENLPVALEALLSLSRIDRSAWKDLILELGLPIDIRPRDASRDILGKVLRLLEIDPEARERLTRRTKHSGDRASPELMRALSSLLAK